MKDEDLYKVAIETRNMEIKLFWERSNYFLVLNTAIAVGFFSLKDKVYTPGFAVLGVIVSLLWYFVNLGSKFWQSRWEQRLAILEEKISPKANMFSASWKTIHADVKKGLSNSNHKGIEKWLDKQIMRKPSVSNQMIFLSLFFIAFWGVFFCIQIITE